MSDISYSDAPKPLTQRERDLVRRIFSDWMEVPGEWKGSLRSYLESDPPVLGPTALGSPTTLMDAIVRDADGRLGVSEGFAVNANAQSEAATSLYVNINGNLLQVRVGQAGSGPGGQGRVLWVD
ncbi:MAG TPA: hypothetical protein VH541_05530 [Gaiellaceae bacterium]